MNYSTMPECKKRFFLEADNGGALMDLNLIRFYTKVDNNYFMIHGLEMEIIETKKFESEAAALEYEKNFWLNLTNILDYNNTYLTQTYSNNVGKYKMLLTQLQNNLKRFYNQNKSFGYYF